MSESRQTILSTLNWPNRISIMRLLLVAPLVIALMNQQTWEPARHIALVIFVIMGISDALDGMLARRTGARTRLGAILDPLADKVMVICTVVLLSLQESSVPDARLPGYVVVAIVGKDLWVIAGFMVIYLVTDRFRIQPTPAGKLSTFAQIVMIALTLLAPDINGVQDKLGSYLAIGAAWIVVALSILAAASYTALGLRFIAREEKPLDEHNEEYDNTKNEHH